MLSPTVQERQLQPRYRRILSFGDVLDESIGIFRRHWVVYALISAVWLIPPGVVATLLTAQGTFDTSGLLAQLQRGVAPTPSSFYGLAASFLLLFVISILFYLAWSVAVVLTTDDYLHGVEPTTGGILAHTLRRFLPVLLSGLIYFVGMAIVGTLAGVLFVVSLVLVPIFLLGSLAALVGILVWWLKPTARRTWLKWLIIVATPMGLAMYFGVAWSLYAGAIVLERHRPVEALRRSTQLVDRHWFRVVAVLALAGIIVSVLRYVPSAIIEVPLTVTTLARGQATLSPIEVAASAAVGVVSQVLFQSLASIVYTVLYVDLRNRREGTDLAERVSQLESPESMPTDV